MPTPSRTMAVHRERLTLLHGAGSRSGRPVRQGSAKTTRRCVSHSLMRPSSGPFQETGPGTAIVPGPRAATPGRGAADSLGRDTTGAEGEHTGLVLQQTAADSCRDAPGTHRVV